MNTIWTGFSRFELLSGFLTRSDALFSGSEKGTTVQKTSNMNLPIS